MINQFTNGVLKLGDYSIVHYCGYGYRVVNGGLGIGGLMSLDRAINLVLMGARN